MFQSLSNNLSRIFKDLTSKGALTESMIKESMREIRIALLESDVALDVVKDFINKVSEKSLGEKVLKSISPGQLITKIVHDELVEILKSDNNDDLRLNKNATSSILMLGLQGTGKTTSSAKIANYLNKTNKKILLVSLDTYRPSAQEQLEILAKQIGVDSLEINKNEKPIEIVKRAKNKLKENYYDVVIYDSAGRLHIDSKMMDELIKIDNLISPEEKLLVIDSMSGQDAINSSKAFNDNIKITGLILTKIDGDSKGGAALSAKHITNTPIKFVGSSEKIDGLEKFDPENIASRILGKGDVVSLVEKAQEIFDKDESEQLTKKLQKGTFDFKDYYSQLNMVNKMGGLSGILNYLPKTGLLSKLGGSQSNEAEDTIKKHQAIINSMTTRERNLSDNINASRKIRIANGSGTKLHEVNKLLKVITNMNKIMKKAKNMKNLSSNNFLNRFM